MQIRQDFYLNRLISKNNGLTKVYRDTTIHDSRLVTCGFLRLYGLIKHRSRRLATAT